MLTLNSLTYTMSGLPSSAGLDVMHLGVIADDVTGGTDLASVLRRDGLSVVQTLGVPESAPPPADVVVVSLKTRTAPVDVATSRGAVRPPPT